MTLLAAFGVLLSQVSGQESVVVGSPIAGRRHPDAFPLVGYFVNWLPLHVHVRRAIGFEDLLRSVRERTLDAFAHQDLSLETILDALGHEIDASLRTAVQIMFVLEHSTSASVGFSGLEAEAVQVPSKVGRFDLALFVVVSERAFELYWEYSSDLFEQATISLLSARFERLLDLLLRHPREAIEGLTRL